MIFLKLLLSSGLIFFITATSLIDKQFILLDYIKPEHYDIKFVPYVISYNQDTFYGECNISINILQPTHTINLYSDVRCILNVKLTDNPPRFQQYDEKKIIIYKPIKYLRDSKTQIVEFFFKNELSSGRYILNIKFIGVVADNGGFKTFSLMKSELNHVIANNGSTKTFSLIQSKNDNGGMIAATHYQTNGARHLFPCWDKPELKATFNISIILPRNYITFSNMRTRKIKLLKSKRLLIYYDTTPAISTSVVAVVILNRAELFIRNALGSASYMWNRNFISNSMFYTQTIIQNITTHLKNKWKRSSKVLKTDHVVIPDFCDKNMINLGLVLYKEFDVAYKETLHPVGHKIKVLRLVVSKVLREWFSFWSHSWLTEAFISFFGAYVVDKIIPDSRMMDLFVVQIQQECLHLDANYNMWPVNSKINSEIPYYIRASVILHMLQHTIGENAFWKGILTYIYDNTNKWDSSNDFWTATQTAFDETSSFSFKEFNITEQMDPWIKQKHYPILNVIRNSGGFQNITLEIVNTSNDWNIPLTYTTRADLNFNNTLPEIWLNMSDMGSVYILDFTNSSDRKLNEAEWIIFNLKQTGYFRVNYDAKNWQLISDYLNSPYFRNIHVLNRAQLIDDAFHLMIARQLDSSIFWDLTKYLRQEKDYVAWYPMFKALEQMSSVFQLQDPEVDAIKENMNAIFNRLLQKLEYDEIVKYSDSIEKYETDFKKSLRQEAAKWACFFGEISCKVKAYDILINLYIFRSYTFQHKIINILPWWKEWVYCNGLSMVDHSTWWTIFSTLENNYDNRLIKLLACARHFTIVKSYLTTISNTIIMQQSSKSEHLVLLAKDFVDSFPFIIAKHVKDKDILSYILYEVLYFTEPRILPNKFNMITILIIIINHVYSQQELNVINNYINNVTTTYKTIKFSTTVERKIWENIAQHVSRIYNKIQIRESEIESQKKYLQSFKLNNNE